MNAPAGSDLSALFAPSSVAVVGASDDPRKLGNWIAVQALRGDRPVHLVNRSKTHVLGRETVPDVRSVGSAVDLVVIAVPAAGFESAVDDALAGGARAIVGVSGGFVSSVFEDETSRNESRPRCARLVRASWDPTVSAFSTTPPVCA